MKAAPTRLTRRAIAGWRRRGPQLGPACVRSTPYLSRPSPGEDHASRDVITRLYGERLTKALGHPFAPHYMPGAAGAIALRAGTRAPKVIAAAGLDKAQ